MSLNFPNLCKIIKKEIFTLYVATAIAAVFINEGTYCNKLSSNSVFVNWHNNPPNPLTAALFTNLVRYQ